MGGAFRSLSTKSMFSIFGHFQMTGAAQPVRILFTTTFFAERPHFNFSAYCFWLWRQTFPASSSL
jgi:hypothetical protein